jgi:hypothetical protein
MMYAVVVSEKGNEQTFHVTVDAPDEKAAGEQAVAYAKSEYGAGEKAKVDSVVESDAA